jgi:signal transduction histidine kinase
MRSRRIRLAIGVLGTLIALIGEALVLNAGRPPSSALLHLAIGLAYLYGGIAIWNHESANRTGRLMTLVGLTWFVGTATGATIPIVRELGLALEDSFSAILVALVLSYPHGRLESHVDRAAIVILAIGSTALNVVFSTSFFLPGDATTGLFGGLALATLTTVVIVRRWIVAPRRSRRDLLPVLVAGAVFLVTLGVNIVRRIAVVPDDAGAILMAARELAPAAIPVALLIGFFRQSERRLGALVEALPDRMFRYTREGSYVDSAGQPAGMTQAGEVLSSRRLHGIMFSAAGHEALAAAAAALDRGQLEAFDLAADMPGGRRQFEVRVAPSGHDEVTAIVRDFTEQRASEAELRRSRARILEATAAERQRLERDLHDGAQQRLVSLSLALRLLRAHLGRAGDADSKAIDMAEEAASELKTAIRELRELARGIHPAILTEAGLGPALEALVDRSVVPASLGVMPDRRMSQTIEATAYFVVSEALANVAKYSSATSATVGASCTETALRVEIADDGVGGADESRGTGIRGLRDRVAALGGRLTITSPAGVGTLVVAEIPIA